MSHDCQFSKVYLVNATPVFDFQEFIDEAKVIRHCAPIFFMSSPEGDPSTICANGTIALLDTGSKKLLVTCAHVWQGFVDYKLSVPTARLCTIFASGFGFPINLGDEPIDFDDGLDLAVFEAKPEKWNMGHKEFYRIDRWPIAKAKTKDPITFVGFPGAGRDAKAGLGNFGYASFGMIVSDVSDRKLVIAGRHSDGHLLDNQGNKLPPMSIAGLSGSPAYVRDGKARFLLAGFVQMGRTSSDDMFLTHAAFLKRDGTLRH